MNTMTYRGYAAKAAEVSGKSINQWAADTFVNALHQ